MTNILVREEMEKMKNDELIQLFKEYTDKALIQKNIEQAIKLLINSLYGYLGSPYSRFYNKYIAEAITLTGQAIIRTSAEVMNKDLDKITGEVKDRVVGVDTDSNYIDVTDVVNSEKTKWYLRSEDEIVTLLDKFCDTRMEKVITEGFNDLFDELNAFDRCVFMKREAIGSGTFVQKKRYTMYVYDNEKVRYAKPKLKIIGLEAVRSSTPKFFREKMKEIYTMMYTHGQDEIHKRILEIKDEYMKLPIETIGKPTGMNGMEDYDNGSSELGNFRKGTTAQVKAALTYNRMIKNMGLTGKYQLIKSGDKIKVYEVKLPNPFKNDKVAILDKLPPEFMMETYVNREDMFEDYFAKPINAVLSARKWHAFKQINLDDIFG